MTLEQYQVPNKTKVSLEPGIIYYFEAQFIKSSNVAKIYLYPRGKRGIQPFSSNIEASQLFSVDGTLYDGFMIDYGSATFLVFVNGGIDEMKFRALYHFLGSNPANQYTLPYTSDSLARSIERIAPRNGEAFGGIGATSIASGGTDLTGTLFTGTAGDIALFNLSISQDALGTTPHASYVLVTDPNGNNIVQQYGAMGNGSLQVVIPLGLSGTYKYQAHNGDSVTHYFLVQGLVIHG